MKKIIISILVCSVVVLSVIGYMLFEISNLSVQSRNVESAGIITRSAMSFQKDMFLAKFEIWQYAHGLMPGDLDTFHKYNELLSQLIDKIMMQVQAGNSKVYTGGLSDFNNIKTNFTAIQSGWQKTIADIENDQKISDANQREAALSQLRAAMDQDLLKNGIFFDSQNVNDGIDRFVTAQEDYLKQELINIDGMYMAVQTGIVILAGLYMVMLALIAIWLGSMIKEMKNYQKNNK